MVRGPPLPEKAAPAGVLRWLWRANGFQDEPRSAPGAALELDQVQGVTLRNVSFRVDPGEIVGIAGLSEAGVSELPRLLGGVLHATSGTIRVAGRPLARDADPRDIIRAGMAVLPADRLHSGGIAMLSMAENAVLPELYRYWHHPGRERSVLMRMIESFGIRPPVPSTLFGKLSGGNQQKTLLGKWLLLRPAVLVLDDPTNGVDPNARETIFALLREAAAEGVGILMFSTEPEQFASICSRVIVLRNGSIVTELIGAGLAAGTISQWCYA